MQQKFRAINQQQTASPFTKNMRRAMRLASWAENKGEIPIAALITDKKGKLMAVAQNKCHQDKDPTAHAEMIAIKRAIKQAKRQGTSLRDCVLYVTLEPCPMCAAAIALIRPERLIYAANDPKSGGALSGPALLDFADQTRPYRKFEVIEGVMELESHAMLQKFFKKIR